MSTILMIIYPTISGPIGGQEGVDASEQLWMSFPFWEASPELVLGLLLVHLAGVLHWEKNIFLVYYNNKELSCPYPGHLGVGWGG
jgi:hypothetical protein